MRFTNKVVMMYFTGILSAYTSPIRYHEDSYSGLKSSSHSWIKQTEYNIQLAIL